MAGDDLTNLEASVDIGDSDRQRRAERVQIRGGLDGEVTVFQPMVVKQMSRTGLQVETSFRLHLQSLHDLRLKLGDRAVIVKARVVHCSISDVDQDVVVYRSGLEFIEPNDRISQVITDFVHVVKQERQPGDA